MPINETATFINISKPVELPPPEVVSALNKQRFYYLPAGVEKIRIIMPNPDQSFGISMSNQPLNHIGNTLNKMTRWDLLP